MADSFFEVFFIYKYADINDYDEPVKYKILETRVLSETSEVTDEVTPGPTKKDGLRLVCADGSILEILRLQPATKKPVDALSFVNGLQGRTVRWVKNDVAAAASAPSSWSDSFSSYLPAIRFPKMLFRILSSKK